MPTQEDLGDPDELDPDDPNGYELIRPEDFLPTHRLPPDARRMGVDQFTGDTGALVALAASLNGGKRSHRLVAWLLLVVVTVPILTTILFELH